MRYPFQRPKTPVGQRSLVVLLLFSLSSTWSGAPARAANPSPPPQGAVIADLPMLTTEDAPLVYFNLAPPGQPPIRALLDTGLNRSIAGQTALAAFGGERQPGDTEVYTRDTVLGRPLQVHPALLDHPSARSSPYIRVGSDAFAGFVLELDFVARRVRFLDPAKVFLAEAPEAVDTDSLALQTFGARPFVEIALNGVPVLVAVDTSVLVPLWLSPADLRKAGISPRTLPVLRWPTAAAKALRLFETDEVRLGSLELGVLPVIVSKTGHVDAFGMNNGVLGLDLLSQFRVRIDIDGKRMWLKRASPPPVSFGGLPYTLTRGSGAFMTEFGERSVVYGILPGSPAEQLGLLPGDAIDDTVSGMPKLSQQLHAIREQAPLVVSRQPDEAAPAEDVLLPEPPAPTP
jgi:hypothetical protein